MIDAVYPLGTGSRVDDEEIKYSVRCLMKHCKDLGYIYIIGEKPAFFDYGRRIHHIRFEERFKRPAVNTWEKLRVAAHLPLLSQKFLLMNDDFFILKDFMADGLPFYQRKQPDLAKSQYTRQPLEKLIGDYSRTVRRTIDALQKRGLPVTHYGTHLPAVFEKSKVAEVMDEFSEEGNQPDGLSFKILYGNYLEKTGEYGNALTLKHIVSRNELEKKCAGRFAIAARDGVDWPRLKEFLHSRYSEPVEFEKSFGELAKTN